MTDVKPISDDALAAVKFYIRNNPVWRGESTTVASLIARLEEAETAAKAHQHSRRAHYDALHAKGPDEILLVYVERLAKLQTLVTEWRDARRAFLALPPNDPTTRAALDRLANAEHALMKGPAQ